MVLFIVMFAMSQVDHAKYQALKNGLADGFGSSESILDGSDAILDDRLSHQAPTTTEIFAELSPKQQMAVATVLQQQDEAKDADADMAAAQTEYSRLDKIRKRIEAALARHGLADDVQSTIDKRGLVVSLVSKHVVFEPDVADLSRRGQRVVDTLAPVLRDLTEQLRIDGHTNQVKVHPRYYATDWDLSAARAVTVLRRLNEVDRVPGTRLSVSAFGHERPLVDPHQPGSQDVNKRVDIVILPNVSTKTLELLDEIAAARARATTSQGAQG
jgi:chemotaxis protein MotB